MTSTAACVAVGSELLAWDRLDSNSLTITRTLARYGVRVVEKRVVGDSVDLVAGTVRELLERVDVVVVTGGLGPTNDDITREAVARAVGRELVHSSEVEGWIGKRYREYGRDMPSMSLRMAEVVDGSRPLPNNRGSAPGLLIALGDRLLAAFPGVPWEMEEMLERDLVPEIERRHPGARVEMRTLLLGGVFESDIEDRIRPMYDRFGRHRITILAKCGVVRLILSAEGDETTVMAGLDEMESLARELLTDDVAGVNADGLEHVILDLLGRHGSTLATAESCTGGLLGARITEVAGASGVYLGGVVSYSNEVKERQLGVPEDLLVEHGAVSEPVARAMADGVRRRLDSDWGIGITGVAGPGGGTEDKPVGLVHWAVASPRSVTSCHRLFPGDRAAVRLWGVHSALDLLRRTAATELGT